MVQTVTIESWIGPLTLSAQNGAVVGIGFGAHGVVVTTPAGVLARAATEIGQYLAGIRTEFEFPHRFPEGTTPFTRRVCEALREIPRGETRTYAEVAKALGTSARAVGGACGRNPLPLVVPCHRVVAAAGIGGFSGTWEKGPSVDIKRKLLGLERGKEGL